MRLTRHFFPCSSPFPWKIYERCPGGHEFLPHQVLCERITTMSVPQRQLVQDRMHWSFKVGRKAAQRKMGWVGGIVMKWKEEKISLHSGPHAGAARAIMWMEMISFPGFNAEVGASGFPAESLRVCLTCTLLPAASSDLSRKIIVRMISTEQSAHGEISLCLSCSHAVTHWASCWSHVIIPSVFQIGCELFFNTLCPGCAQIDFSSANHTTQANSSCVLILATSPFFSPCLTSTVENKTPRISLELAWVKQGWQGRQQLWLWRLKISTDGKLGVGCVSVCVLMQWGCFQAVVRIWELSLQSNHLTLSDTRCSKHWHFFVCLVIVLLLIRTPPPALKTVQLMVCE